MLSFSTAPLIRVWPQLSMRVTTIFFSCLMFLLLTALASPPPYLLYVGFCSAPLGHRSVECQEIGVVPLQPLTVKSLIMEDTGLWGEARARGGRLEVAQSYFRPGAGYPSEISLGGIDRR